MPGIRGFLVSMPGAKLSVGRRRFKIHNLPLEIFKMILTEAAAEDETNDIFSPTDTFYSAQELSLVCKHWRTVILSTPSVWSTISSSLPEPFIKLALTRSAHAPLALYIDLEEPYNPYEDTDFTKVIPLMGSGICRAAILYCRLSRQRWPLLRDYLHGEAPLLESFMLEYQEIHEAPFTISQLFNNTYPPRLRNLVLKGCRILWDSPLLNNLTKLTLSAQDRPSYTQFMAVLRRLPRLEELALDDGLPAEYPGAAQNDIITLSCLRKVDFCDRARHCTSFLHVVKFNPCLVQVFVKDDGPLDCSELLSACAHRLSILFETCPLVRLDLQSASSPYDSASAAVTGYSCLDSDDFCDVVFHITLGLPTAEDWVRLLTPALNILPLSHVQDVTCKLRLPFPPSWWIDTFSPKLPCLTDLTINGGTDDFFRVFAQAVGTTQHGDTASPLLLPLPSLEEIYGDFRLPRTEDMMSVVNAYRAQGSSLALTPLHPATILDFTKRMPA